MSNLQLASTCYWNLQIGDSLVVAGQMHYYDYLLLVLVARRTSTPPHPANPPPTSQVEARAARYTAHFATGEGMNRLYYYTSILLYYYYYDTINYAILLCYDSGGGMRGAICGALCHRRRRAPPAPRLRVGSLRRSRCASRVRRWVVSGRRVRVKCGGEKGAE